MREPGPFGGSNSVLDAALEAIKERNPQSAGAWAEAIVDVTHGDYAEATQGLLDFSPEIDDDPARPAEKMGDADVVGQNHFAVVLDASGSMAETPGGTPRMQEAKSAVEAFASQLPESSTLSLRVYGHKGSNAGADKAESCAATEVVYEGSPTGVGEAMAKFEPTGWTPLGAAILAARQDIPAGASDAIVYVVTDGLETCGGDPVEAARQLAAEGVKPVVNVIGFQVGDADQAELRRIADAGGGDFIDARSGADLTDYWQEERSRMMAAWTEWQDQALARIRDQGSANMKAADDFGDILMDGLTQEWNNQSAALAVLKEDGVLDYETSQAAWTSLLERQRTLWQWGFNKSTSSWQDSFDVQTSRWQDAYHLGSGKWTEYYRKDS